MQIFKQRFDEKLKEQFLKTYTFSNHDNNKFILSLPKGIYPYECMGDWEKFNETSLAEQEDFHNHLNMEDITDEDFVHTKRVCKDFEMKDLKDLWFVCSEWYIIVCWCIWELLKYVLKYMNLIPLVFFQLLDPGLAWQVALKKSKIKLDLLTNINMLLTVEKSIRGGICHSIYP